MMMLMTEQGSSMQRPMLTVVVPAYNEEVLIDSSLRQLHQHLQAHSLLATTEVIVVAAGSDKTARLAAQQQDSFAAFQLIEPADRKGKGRDVRLGMLAAQGEHVVFMDADLATPLHHLGPMLEQLQDGRDVVIGVRDISSAHKGFTRRIGSMAGNMLIRLLAVRGIKDTQCGFKGFSAAVAQRLFGQQVIDAWGFDFEILAMAQRFDMSIGTVTIDDWHDPKGDQALVGELHATAMLHTLRELLQVRLNIIRGRYE